MDNDNVNSTEKNWLIKSSTRILGPFTLAEVAELLRTKQVSIIDEVRRPEGRWSYIRENQIFLDIVKNIRAEQDEHSEETMTQSIAQHTMTKTDAIALSDDLTPTPAPHHMDLTPPPVRDVDFKDVTPAMEKPQAKSAAVTRSYGASGDARVQGRMKKRSSILRWVLISISLVIAAVIVASLMLKGRKANVGYDELIAQAIRYKTLGLYEKSLQTYLRATKLKEPDAEAQVQMASVLISEDRQSLLGRRILERALIKEGRTRAEVMDAYLGIAVSYMMDGDLKQAEDILQKAIGHEPFNVSALLNLAIIEQKKGNYAQAMRDFESIYRKNPQSVLALFGRAVATVEYAKQSMDTLLLKNLVQDIKSSVKRTGYLRQELLLLNVYAQFLIGDYIQVQDGISLFLNEVPGQAKKYSHPLHVDWRFTQWDYLDKYCEDLYQQKQPTAQVKAFRSVCLMEINRDADAAKLLQEAHAEAPKDPYVAATNANYLARVGRLPEAMAILKTPELASLSVKNFLLGDICLNTQDVPCVQNAYTQIYNQDSSNAVALFGLAWVVLRNNDRSMAYDYVRAGLQSEPNYLPLLELRDQLEYQ